MLQMVSVVPVVMRIEVLQMVGVDMGVVRIDTGGVLVEVVMRLGTSSRDGVGRSRSPRRGRVRSSSGEGQRSHVRWCCHYNGRDGWRLYLCYRTSLFIY